MSIFDRNMSIEALKNGRGILKVPEGVTELSGDFALVFDWMPEKSCQCSFREIQLPSSVQKINGIFLTEYGPDEAPIKRFKSITVSEDNQYFTDIDGVLFSKDLTQLICYPCGKVGQTYIVPDSVEVICEYAFADNVNLKKIVLPDSLRRIEYQAFFQCENLSDINLPHGLEYIGEECFGLTTNLNRLIVPTTVKQIPTSLFYEGSVISVPNKIELKYDFVPTEYLNMPFSGPAILSIQNDELVDFAKSYDYNHFEDCYEDKEGIIWANHGNRLVCFPVEWTSEEYELPDKVKEVYIGAFRGCSLKRFFSNNKIVIVGRTTDTPRYFEPMSGYKFHITAFEIYCDDNKGLTSDILEEKDAKVICADENGHIIIPDHIKKIGAYAFNCRKDIVRVTLPNGLTTIEESAFNACHNLTEINIPQSVVSIGDDAFARCFKLHSITLPDGIESINAGTFQHCSNLQKVIVPATLKSIDRIAFWYCHKLKEIALTDTVNYIFEDAFDGCISLSIVAPVGSYARNYADKHGYIMNKSKNKVDGSDNIRESSSNRYAFISYSSKNQSMADSFRTLLNQNGVKTWMAPGDIPVGSSYMKEINHALKDCACLVLLLSNAAQGSLWVIKEVERAVNYHKPIIPVQIDEVILNDEFEFVLGSYQVVAVQRIDQDSAETKKVLNSIIAATGMSSNLPIKTSKTYYLKSSEDLNLKYPLKPGLNIIGTDLRKATIVLQKKTVSRIHAAINISEQEIILQNINATNGTYLNGQQLIDDEERTISEGDILRFGNEEYLVCVDNSNIDTP